MDEGLQVTWGFAQVWLDKQTSANCKAGLQFGLDKHRRSLILNFIKILLINSGSGGRNPNPTPAQSPVRWLLPFSTPQILNLSRLFIFLFLIAFFSCQEHKRQKQVENVVSSSEKINSAADTALWDSLKNLTVLSFLEKAIINKDDNKQLNFITIEDDGTSNNWIKPKDIDTLIALTKSKRQCKCVVDPLSSYLPTDDYAELGGYAILLLKQYKDKKDIRFSLYACPKTNEKEADELIKWWTQIAR